MIELLLEAEGALSVGLLDRAEILYRQVAAADPRNSIAVVGLARVTLERDDEPGALNLARRALRIDPENTAAQRMVQRLEEVLAHRGATLPPPPQPDEREAGVSATPVPADPVPTGPVPADPVPIPASPPRDAPSSSPKRRSLVDRLLGRR